MYEPRRVLGPVGTEDVQNSAPTPQATAFTKPRRAALTWRDQLGQRAGLGLVTLAAVATSGAVIFGSGPAAAIDLAAPAATLERDAAPLSRAATERVSPATLQVHALSTSKLAEATEDLVAQTPLFTTGELNVRAKPSADAKLLGSVEAGTKVIATPAIEGKYRKVTAGKLEGWVLAKNLADEVAEVEDAAAGITMEKCSRGSGIEGKLRPDTIRIYRSVCALFPGVNSYGGWRAGGRQFHKNGRALDIMLTPGKESALGWRIAKYLTANAKTFNIDHVIFEQKIWTPSTPRWRGMADRGGTTANHYDHVHVAIRA